MKSIQIDFSHNIIRNSILGYQLRVGYILSDKISTAGMSTHLMYFPEAFKKLSFEQKLKLVENSAGLDNNLAMYIKTFRDTQKRNRAFKHLPKDLLISFKWMEHLVNKVLTEWGNHYVGLGQQAGLDMLFPLISKDIFDAYSLDDPKGEDTKLSIDKMGLFNHTLPANTAVEAVWLMPFTFFKEILLPQNCCTVFQDISSDAPFLIKAFQLPNINILNTMELKSIHMQLPKQIAPFQEAVDIWARACYKGDASKVFIETLEPLFAETSHALSKNDILEHCDSIHFGEARTTIFMGAVSPLDIWNFYHKEGELSEEQMQELETAYHTGNKYFVPVMCFSEDEDLYKPFVAEEHDVSDKTIDDIISAKKYITIDD